MSLQDAHKQLNDVVSDRLRAAILEGQFRPGQWMRQRQIAEQLGVSQMPVREALKELAAEGLVEHVPYRGVRVIKFSVNDVADLYTHRSFLEGMAARYAAQNITPNEISQLRTLQAQMQQNLAPEQLAEYRRLNRLFHQTVFVASRRDYLMRTLNQMWSTFPTMLWSNFAQTASRSLPERDATDIAEHDAIIHALENGDTDKAEQLVRHHIRMAGEEFVAALRAVETERKDAEK